MQELALILDALKPIILAVARKIETGASAAFATPVAAKSDRVAVPPESGACGERILAGSITATFPFDIDCPLHKVGVGVKCPDEAPDETSPAMLAFIQEHAMSAGELDGDDAESDPDFLAPSEDDMKLFKAEFDAEHKRQAEAIEAANAAAAAE